MVLIIRFLKIGNTQRFQQFCACPLSLCPCRPCSPWSSTSFLRRRANSAGTIARSNHVHYTANPYDASEVEWCLLMGIPHDAYRRHLFLDRSCKILPVYDAFVEYCVSRDLFLNIPPSLMDSSWYRPREIEHKFRAECGMETGKSQNWRPPRRAGVWPRAS